jgi:SAM-dependent methyltransferase
LLAEHTLSQAAKSYQYDQAFYRYIEAGAIRSAKAVVPIVLRELQPSSVLDVGCGAGAWLSIYRDLEITSFLGIDGDYVQPGQLLIPHKHFRGLNISQPFMLDSKFDLVQCLEVGEHLPESCSATLVDNLTRHSDRVLFSAATPGQGGENHINEQTFEFWRRLFAAHGFKPFDPFRRLLRGRSEIESWYRRNMILYVAGDGIASLPASVASTAIADNQKIPEVGSIVYKIRSGIVSLLPLPWVSRLAIAKHNALIAYRSRGAAK